MALEPCWEYPHQMREVASRFDPVIPEEAIELLEERDRALEDRLCETTAGGENHWFKAYHTTSSGNIVTVGNTGDYDLTLQAIESSDGETLSAGKKVLIATAGMWLITAHAKVINAGTAGDPTWITGSIFAKSSTMKYELPDMVSNGPLNFAAGTDYNPSTFNWGGTVLMPLSVGDDVFVAMTIYASTFRVGVGIGVGGTGFEGVALAGVWVAPLPGGGVG